MMKQKISLYWATGILWIVICLSACQSSAIHDESILGPAVSKYLDVEMETVLENLEQSGYEIETIETDGYTWEDFYVIREEIADGILITELQFGIYGDHDVKSLAWYKKHWTSAEINTDMQAMIDSLYKTYVGWYGQPASEDHSIDDASSGFYFVWYDDEYTKPAMLEFSCILSTDDADTHSYTIYIEHKSPDNVKAIYESWGN